MRKCVICGIEKELEKFRKRKIWFSHTCKACYAAQYRTGKINTTRFKKGHVPWIKGKKINCKKLKVPRKPRIRLKTSLSKTGSQSVEWSLEVKKRDNFTCQQCGVKDKLDAHHIIPWSEDESKRFLLDNGITLCKRCHSSTERLLEWQSGKRKKKD